MIVDDYEIRGGGIVREALPDRQSEVREKVMLRNLKWEPSIIPPSGGPRSTASGRRCILDHRRARQRPQELGEGAGGPAVRRMAGWCISWAWPTSSTAWTPTSPGPGDRRSEHLRRLGEIANMMLDAGAILIVTAQELTQDDLEVIKTSVDPDRIELVWVGDAMTTDVHCDLVMGGQEAEAEGVDRMKQYLQDKGVVFRPW